MSAPIGGCRKLMCIVVFFCFVLFRFVSTMDITTLRAATQPSTLTYVSIDEPSIHYYYLKGSNKPNTIGGDLTVFMRIYNLRIHSLLDIVCLVCYDASHCEVNQLKTLFIYVHVEWCRLSIEMKMGDHWTLYQFYDL